jgi:hypothetical protein
MSKGNWFLIYILLFSVTMNTLGAVVVGYRVDQTPRKYPEKLEALFRPGPLRPGGERIRRVAIVCLVIGFVGMFLFVM